MSKKNETILIRLDSKTKERFRLYCESKRLTMTDVLIDEINILLNSDDSETSPDFSIIKKERDFFKTELSRYEETYHDMYRMFNSLKRKHLFGMDKLYTNLFIEHFERIEQFQGYELIENNINTNRRAEMIAFNKFTNHKLLFEFRISLHSNSLSLKNKPQYYSWLENYGEKSSIELVLISLETVDHKILKQYESLSTKINYDISAYCIDELLKF